MQRLQIKKMEDKTFPGDIFWFDQCISKYYVDIGKPITINSPYTLLTLHQL